jgi:hypothetical protein
MGFLFFNHQKLMVAEIIEISSNLHIDEKELDPTIRTRVASDFHIKYSHKLAVLFKQKGFAKMLVRNYDFNYLGDFTQFPIKEFSLLRMKFVIFFYQLLTFPKPAASSIEIDQNA